MKTLIQYTYTKILYTWLEFRDECNIFYKQTLYLPILFFYILFVKFNSVLFFLTERVFDINFLFEQTFYRRAAVIIDQAIVCLFVFVFYFFVSDAY